MQRLSTWLVFTPLTPSGFLSEKNSVLQETVLKLRKKEAELEGENKAFRAKVATLKVEFLSTFAKIE